MRNMQRGLKRLKRSELKNFLRPFTNKHTSESKTWVSNDIK